MPRFRKVRLQGCTAAEIRQLERQAGVEFPQAYREFLKALGRGAGDFLEDDHWRFRIDELPIELEELELPFQPPDQAFVFAERNSCFWAYFLADGKSDDPPVYVFSEGSQTSQQAAVSLWRFVEHRVRDRELAEKHGWLADEA